MRCFIIILLTSMLCGCAEQTGKNVSGIKKQQTPIPAFDGENAFRYLKAQVDFGPRVPNTLEHKACRDFLFNELSKYADEVKLQNFSDNAYGKILYLSNIIASFNKSAQQRILLCAHWDTHPWANQDINPNNRNLPIPGANDGASGVAVLLEIARILKSHPPEKGVDIVLFDGEDYAKPSDIAGYLRGSKYFARNKPSDYNPMFGILLDMIGDAQLEILKEGYSIRYASDIVQLVWNIASELNYIEFSNQEGIEIIDDHLPLNEVGIKTINLIDFNYPDETNRYWHTLEDTPDKCSPNSLKVVGTVLLHLIYRNY